MGISFAAQNDFPDNPWLSQLTGKLGAFTIAANPVANDTRDPFSDNRKDKDQDQVDTIEFDPGMTALSERLMNMIYHGGTQAAYEAIERLSHLMQIAQTQPQLENLASLGVYMHGTLESAGEHNAAGYLNESLKAFGVDATNLSELQSDIQNMRNLRALGDASDPMNAMGPIHTIGTSYMSSVIAGNSQLPDNEFPLLENGPAPGL